jgi:hypothetical protein
MLTQLQQQNQQLSEALNQATEMLNTQKLQLDTQERMQLRDIEAKRNLAELKIASDMTQTGQKIRSDVAQTGTKVDSQESIAQLNAETKVATEAMKIAAKPRSQERPPLYSFEED